MSGRKAEPTQGIPAPRPLLPTGRTAARLGLGSDRGGCLWEPGVGRHSGEESGRDEELLLCPIFPHLDPEGMMRGSMSGQVSGHQVPDPAG